jgi:hypothetical protein
VGGRKRAERRSVSIHASDQFGVLGLAMHFHASRLAFPEV